MKPTFRLLTDEQQSEIAAAAFELLERVGVKLTEPEAQALLVGAGAQIGDDRVTIPTHLVEEAIQSAPQGISIYKRDGELAMRLEGRNYYYGAHTDAPDVLDPFTNQRRACLEEDVRRNAVLIDALPNISYSTASGLVADRRPELADRVALAQCLKNSTKPVLAMPVTLRALADSQEMAALVVGGEDALQDQPLMIIYSEPVSPLVHPDESVRKLLYCAEHEIPLVYTPFAAMGSTAPLSQVGIIAQLCAESLSGLVVHQLKRRGAPFIFGGMPSVMDMKTMIFSYGAPEFQLGNSMMAEMAHYFKLPNFGTAGTSDSQIFDGQAVLEATSSCIMAALSGANLVHDVGLLGNATIVMPDMIVATDEIINMIRHLLPEMQVNEEALALSVIRDVGPGGEFVTHPHTHHNFRDVWYPDLLYRGGAKAWGASGQLTFEQRVNARTRELIESHQPELLPGDIVEQIQAIIARSEEGERLKSMTPSGEWGQEMTIELVAEGLQFPEGPFWSSRDNCVYFVESSRDTICTFQDGKVRIIHEFQLGDEPCGLCQDNDGNLWLCMYSSRELLHLRPSGEILQKIEDHNGERFKGPNDLVTDAKGGIYFTDSGDIKDDWITGRPAGAVYYLTPEGKLLQLDSKLCYPNGIAISLDGKSLIVNEHRKNRVLKYFLNPAGTLSNRKVFFEFDSECLLAESLRYQLGPDGMCLDSHGNFWVAHYGGGKVVALSPGGKLLGKLYLPRGRRPTNLTFDVDENVLYITEGELGLLYRVYLE